MVVIRRYGIGGNYCQQNRSKNRIQSQRNWRRPWIGLTNPKYTQRSVDTGKEEGKNGGDFMAVSDCTIHSANSLLENISYDQVILKCSGYPTYNIRKMLIMNYAIQFNFPATHRSAIIPTLHQCRRHGI